MNPQNQTLLALVITAILVSGFFGVYVVTSEYQSNNVSQIMFTSDSNTEFGDMDISAVSPFFPVNLQLMSYSEALGGNVFEYHNATPIYIGNNTWDTSFIGYPTDTYLLNQYYIPILLPNLNTYLMDNIDISFTIPPEDITVRIYVLSTNNPMLINETVFYTNIFEPTSYTTASSFNESIDISIYQALKIKNEATEYPYNQLIIEITDTGANGISGSNMNLNLEISGTLITSWSLQDSINTVIGISIGLNIFLIIYMTDAIDFDTIRSDLKSKKVKQSRQKRRKTKRDW